LKPAPALGLVNSETGLITGFRVFPSIFLWEVCALNGNRTAKAGINGTSKMHKQTQQVETSQAPNGAFPPPRQLYTLKKFAERNSGFLTLSAITNQVFKAQPRHSSKGEIPGNGMLDFAVIVRSGRTVLIDETAYFRWLDAQQEGGQ
jgi:hypothetical protein